MPALRTLKVYPNPYKVYDHEGRPCNVVPFEPEGDGVSTFDSRKFVGAQLKVKVLKKFPEGDARQTEQENTFEYQDDPVTVRDTPYYREALRRGDLIAADAETARKLGKKFVDPKKVLETEKAGAIHYYENIEKHDDTPEKAPDALRNHGFGPTKQPPEKKDETPPAGDKPTKGAK